MIFNLSCIPVHLGDMFVFLVPGMMKVLEIQDCAYDGIFKVILLLTIQSLTTAIICLYLKFL